jgi:mobilome CxxCx(11)CxxC protein
MAITQQDIQHSCQESAFHLYATYYLYGRKSRKKDTWLQLITLLGLLVPVLIGGIVASYGLTSQVSYWFLAILTPIAVLQLALSTLAVVYKWDDKKNYYLASSISNRQLYAEFTNLAKFPPSDLGNLSHRFELLTQRLQNQDDQDDNYPLTDKELRRGMRYSLRQYQKPCAGCNKTPTSMKSTDCGVCGNFNFLNI